MTICQKCGRETGLLVNGICGPCQFNEQHKNDPPVKPRVQELEEVLEQIYDDLGKADGVCRVCFTFTHKAWCWYPRLCQALGKPLDKFDKEHLEKMERIEKW